MPALVIVLTALAVLTSGTVPVVWAQTTTKSETKAGPPVKTQASAPAVAPAPKKEAEKKAEKKDSETLDLNTAAAADLKGAGFSDTEAEKDIVTKEKYEQVKEGIIAHQVKTEAKKK
jgi:hypothetical protein